MTTHGQAWLYLGVALVLRRLSDGRTRAARRGGGALDRCDRNCGGGAGGVGSAAPALSKPVALERGR